MSFNRAHKQEISLDFDFKFKAQIQAQKDEVEGAAIIRNT